MFVVSVGKFASLVAYQRVGLTWRMANLCISPVHAGIMPFNTANSSFILDLRRRSIRLCAVFLAIFRPAALVADGCFFFDAAAAVPFDAAALEAVEFLADGESSSGSSCFGFIWMIFRDLVGGGGSVKASLAAGF